MQKKGAPKLEGVLQLGSKVFTFIFEGHEYTASNSACNQGHCPHCDHPANDKFMYDVFRDKEAFIGYYTILCTKNKPDSYIACFECLNCFEKFYYHSDTRFD